MRKHKAIIIDLDGTLCDVDHRVHHVKSKPKNWDAFNQALNQDRPHFWCIELMTAMRSYGYKIYFVTGRGENYRKMTIDWLEHHKILFDELHMRKDQDFREDSEVKEEIYINKIEKISQVLFVVDDRKSVVERWRKLGLTCLQCAVGDF